MRMPRVEEWIHEFFSDIDVAVWSLVFLLAIVACTYKSAHWRSRDNSPIKEENNGDLGDEFELFRTNSTAGGC